MSLLIDADHKIVLLSTQSSSYAFTWGEELMPLRHLHWGAKLEAEDLTSLALCAPELRRIGALSKPRSSLEEYSFLGGLRREEVALSVTMPDGVRSLDLKVADVSQTGPESLTVLLTDPAYPIEVELHYRADPASDAISRSVTLRNTGEQGTMLVDRAASAGWDFPATPGWQLTTATGVYGAEFHTKRFPAQHGSFEIGSRNGLTGHDALSWMAVDIDAGLHHGEVWAVTLEWSGSWSISTQLAHDQALTVYGGLNPFDQPLRLDAGSELKLPAMTGVYSPEGHDGAARRFHRYAIGDVMVRPQTLRPVLYNSWEARYFEVDADSQMALADQAAALGAELFVIDDGWFSTRTDDAHGLGDWWPAPDKFPEGLQPVVDHVHGLGMKFGIWVEPEMCNPHSELYQAHPDWIHRWATREPTLQRNQYVLDFGRQEVRDWALATLTELVSKHGIDYLKWDMNRPIVEPASPNALYRHTMGLYEVWDELRQRFPDLILEDCASGGGRSDFGALRRCDWVWTSDATDPVERLEIQHGFSQLLPPLAMSCWATDSPNGLTTAPSPLRFRYEVAMQGLLGIGQNLLKLSEEELAASKRWIELYKQIRPVVQLGVRYQLTAPAEGVSALTSVAQDGSEAVLFCYSPLVPYNHALRRVRMMGLQPDAQYRVTDLDDDQFELSATGRWLTTIGLPIQFQGSYQSRILRLQRR